VLKVRDTATGIPEELREKIFDPFFTTKEPGKGTGLGLATVLSIVRAHGGIIAVSSAPGKGTTFKIYLPADVEVAKAGNQDVVARRAPSGRGEFVLVVDDESPMRETTTKLLARAGYQVVTASDGAEGIATLARFQDRIKVVVCDLMMPVMDGVGIVRVVKRINPLLKVIISSGLLEDPAHYDKLAQLKELGVTFFLSKPYESNDLLAALHASLCESNPL
jgi:CheY-like chemotaxis protein